MKKIFIVTTLLFPLVGFADVPTFTTLVQNTTNQSLQIFYKVCNSSPMMTLCSIEHTITLAPNSGNSKSPISTTPVNPNVWAVTVSIDQVIIGTQKPQTFNNNCQVYYQVKGGPAIGVLTLSPFAGDPNIVVCTTGGAKKR